MPTGAETEKMNDNELTTFAWRHVFAWLQAVAKDYPGVNPDETKPSKLVIFLDNRIINAEDLSSVIWKRENK